MDANLGSEDEQAVARMMAELLQLPAIGVHDNFFELGGHSLAATQFLSLLHMHFDVELPISALFAHPSVAGVLEAIYSSEAHRAEGDEGGGGCADEGGAHVSPPLL